MLLLSVENKKTVNAFHFLKPLTQPNKGIEKGKLPLFNTRLHMISPQIGGVGGYGIKGGKCEVVFKRVLFWEMFFSMMLCVVCDGADKANILELSGQLPGQLALPRVIIIILNNDILSKARNDVSGMTFLQCYLSLIHATI